MSYLHRQLAVELSDICFLLTLGPNLSILSLAKPLTHPAILIGMEMPSLKKNCGPHVLSGYAELSAAAIGWWPTMCNACCKMLWPSHFSASATQPRHRGFISMSLSDLKRVCKKRRPVLEIAWRWLLLPLSLERNALKAPRRTRLIHYFCGWRLGPRKCDMICDFSTKMASHIQRLVIAASLRPPF